MYVEDNKSQDYKGNAGKTTVNVLNMTNPQTIKEIQEEKLQICIYPGLVI